MQSFDERRRHVLEAGAGVAAVSLAGCLGFLGEDIEFDEEVPESVADHLSTANNVDGSITDRTGLDELHVENGPDGDLAYDPALVRIDAGTTVTWEWLSDGHTVTSTDGAIDLNTDQESTGFEVSHTFDDPGNYFYECRPHASAGHLGAIIVD